MTAVLMDNTQLDIVDHEQRQVAAKGLLLQGKVFIFAEGMGNHHEDENNPENDFRNLQNPSEKKKKPAENIQQEKSIILTGGPAIAPIGKQVHANPQRQGFADQEHRQQDGIHDRHNSITKSPDPCGRDLNRYAFVFLILTWMDLTTMRYR